MKTKYVYPAVFTEEASGYSVAFPDIEGCCAQGDDLADALEMARDALCITLYDMEESGRTIPAPSNIKAIVCDSKSLVSLVDCNTLEYRKLFNGKAAKKTLSIPAWLNTLAERENINFSRILQEALKAEIAKQKQQDK